MSDQATPTPGAEPESGAAAGPPAVDFGSVFERMDQGFSKLEQSFNQRLEGLQPQNEPEPEPDPYAGLDGMYEDPNEALAARQTLESILNPAIQQALTPLQQQLKAAEERAQRLENDLNLGDLEARYPRLGQDQELAAEVLGQAQQLAEKLGVPNAALNHELVELAFLAAEGRKRAAAETPAGGVPTGLETAGGASPGEPEPSPADQIMQALGPRTKGAAFWQGR